MPAGHSGAWHCPSGLALAVPIQWSWDLGVVGRVSQRFSWCVCIVCMHRSKALHLSARGGTTDPGSIAGCITTGRDWETCRAAHNWPSIVRVWPG